jgi:DNA-binding transcriptional regulator YhcF (GntR family)
LESPPEAFIKIIGYMHNLEAKGVGRLGKGENKMPVNSFEDYPMSWKPRIAQTNKSLYIAIAEQLEHDIKGGTLLPGTQLPPQRELADFLDINVSTISRAFKVCTQKGLLSSTIGSGTFDDGRAEIWQSGCNTLAKRSCG